MTRWLRRLRGAVGMGVTWAVAWALVGLSIGVGSILLPVLPWDVFFEIFDAPLPALAIPGFVAGATFSVVLGIAGRRRRFEELSLARFGAWGAAVGLLLGFFPVLVLLLDPGSTALPHLLQVAAVWSIPVTALSTLSASGSLWLAQRAQERASLGAGDVPPALGGEDR